MHLTVIKKYINNSASVITLIVWTILNVHYHLVPGILQENGHWCPVDKKY